MGPRGRHTQGAVLSPLLSNVYLDPLDHLVESHGFEMVRYADDFVILCRTADEASLGTGTGADVGVGKRPHPAPDEDDGG